MDEPNRHRALAHSGGHSLDRAAAHIARREHARQARLQGVRLPRKSLLDAPLKRRTVQRPPRRDKAVLVELDGPFEDDDEVV
jgi:hypothetical protein